MKEIEKLCHKKKFLLASIAFCGSLLIIVILSNISGCT
jgi:hypothetical protein